MRLGLIELRRRPGRYLAVASAVGFIVALALILSALSDGLYLGATGAYRSTDADVYFFAPESAFQLGRSVVPADAVAEVKGSELVAAAGGFGTLQTAAVADDGTELLLSLLGADGPARPASITAGRFPSDGADEVLVDAQLERRGISIGSRIVVGSGAALTVVGVAEDAGFGLDTAWTGIATWERVRIAVRPELAALAGTVQAIAAALEPGVEPEEATEQLGQIEGLIIGTPQDAISGLPAADQQRTTLGAIVNTTFVVAALVIALFFALVTLEKRAQFAILKALGMGNRALLGAVFVQALVASAVGFVIGFAISRVTEAVLPTSVPALFLGSTATGILVATLLMGAIGAVVTFRRIVRIDPASAIGGNL